MSKIKDLIKLYASRQQFDKLFRQSYEYHNELSKTSNDIKELQQQMNQITKRLDVLDELKELLVFEQKNRHQKFDYLIDKQKSFDSTNVAKPEVIRIPPVNNDELPESKQDSFKIKMRYLVLPIVMVVMIQLWRKHNKQLEIERKIKEEELIAIEMQKKIKPGNKEPDGQSWTQAITSIVKYIGCGWL